MDPVSLGRREGAAHSPRGLGQRDQVLLHASSVTLGKFLNSSEPHKEDDTHLSRKGNEGAQKPLANLLTPSEP